MSYEPTKNPEGTHLIHKYFFKLVKISKYKILTVTLIVLQYVRISTVQPHSDLSQY